MSHPKNWDIAKLADVGTDERFVREMLELFDLLNGTMIEGKLREQACDTIGAILVDGLMPAFLQLRGIRESKGKDLPLIDRYQLYEDFARKLGQGSRQDYLKFYDSTHVESLFKAAPQAVADILVMLMNLRMPPRFHIVEHRDEVFGPGWPNRFRVIFEGILPDHTAE